MFFSKMVISGTRMYQDGWQKCNHGCILMGDVRLSMHMCPITDPERKQLSRYPHRQLIGEADYFAVNSMSQISLYDKRASEVLDELRTQVLGSACTIVLSYS